MVTCIMSRLNDDLEHLELDYLRHQALSSMTPKKKGSSKRREHDTRQLESDFGIDELLGSEKVPKSKHSGRKRGRSTPEISREVIKTFSSRLRKPDHYSGSTLHGDHYYSPNFPPPLSSVRGHSGRAPQWGQVGKKHRKQSSSGSSYSSSASHSRSSFSSSRSSSHSRSHSSSSSSRSSSSRSHSSTSSSYSCSSRSSSRSRSASPPYRRKGRKRSWPLHTLPQSYRGHSHATIKSLKPHPPVERTKRPHPPPRSPDGGWYPEPSPSNRSPHRQPLRPPPPPLPPGPPKRRPRPPPDYFGDERSYYPDGRYPEYPRSRPHSPPPRAEQRVVRQVRYPPNRPPPPRDYCSNKRYRRSPPPPPPPPPPLPPRHGYRSDYTQRGRSDHSYPRERTTHPPEHSLASRSSWREGRERYYRHPKTGDYCSDEDHVTRKENSLVKSSVKVVNRNHRSMRSRSTSPKQERVKRKSTTVLRKASSEKKFVPQKLKARRKSAEGKAGDAAETFRSSPKILKSDKDGDGANTVQMKGVEQTEPTQVKEVPSEEGITDIMQEKDRSGPVSREPGLLDEELDYDENMDELDLYPTGSLDVGVGVEEAWCRRPNKSASPEKTDTCSSVHRKRKRPLRGSGGNKYSDVDTHSNSYSEDSSHQTEHVSPHKKHRGSTSDNEARSNSEEEKNSSPIRSPIRVSPERKESRVVHDTSSHDYRKKSGSTLPVKERLYVSKRTIEEKKWMINYKDESPSKLRPSLANRLGPSPFRRGTRRYDPHHSSRDSHLCGGSYFYGRPSKGDAFVIAEAYRRKKRKEELMRDSEVQKAKKPTRMLDDPGSKISISTTKSVVPLEESQDCAEMDWKNRRTKQSRCNVKQGN